MANNDYPDPNGPKPAGVSDSAWYGYTQVDSTKPLAQWTAWDQYVDPSAKGYARYKSDKVDSNGKPIQGTFEHPDACPEGTTALGHNQCVGTDDPRVNSGSSIGSSLGNPQQNQGMNQNQTQQVPAGGVYVPPGQSFRLDGQDKDVYGANYSLTGSMGSMPVSGAPTPKAGGLNSQQTNNNQTPIAPVPSSFGSMPGMGNQIPTAQQTQDYNNGVNNRNKYQNGSYGSMNGRY